MLMPYSNFQQNHQKAYLVDAVDFEQLVKAVFGVEFCFFGGVRECVLGSPLC
jgi:hypothetical protein